MWFSEEGIAIAKNRVLRELSADGNPVGTHPGKTIIDAELTDQDGIMGYSTTNASPQLVKGQTYVITTDSGTFVEKYELTADVLGNPAVMGGADNGKSYAVAEIHDEVDGKDIYSLVAVDINGGNHITVTEAETTTPIDPKYLPGVCLSLVELSALPESDPITLTAEESAVLDKVAVSCLPIVVKVSKMAGVFDWANEGGADMFVSNPTLGSLALLRTDSLWTFHRLG